MLSPEQESRLTSGGDSPDHWHSTDRLRVHSDIGALEALENVVTPTSGAYSVGPTDNFILANNAGPYTLPLAKSGRIIEIVMTTATPVVVDFSGSDELYGETSLLVEERGTAIRLKAISGGWIII